MYVNCKLKIFYVVKTFPHHRELESYKNLSVEKGANKLFMIS
jgi:hypothetical protein